MSARDGVQFDLSWVRDRRLTIYEIEMYKEETVMPPCLVCGRKLRYLSGHLKTHGMTIMEYREFYGIPRFMKLSDTETRTIKSEQSRDLQKHGVIGWRDRAAMRDHAHVMRCIPRNLIRSEIKQIVAINNCNEINRGRNGVRERKRKLAATHTDSDTRELLRMAAITGNSHIRMVEACAERGWAKTAEHESRRLSVLRERADIIRSTPVHMLDQALADFKERCRIERNRRIVAKRRAKRRAKEVEG